MDNIAIQTAQNIAIDQTAASVAERLVAEMIDLIFMVAYIFLIALFGEALSSPPWLMIILFIPVAFYHLMAELTMDGQTWGKKIMKIKVVKADGTRITFSSFLLRWVFRLVDVYLFFGAIATSTIIIAGKGQRFGDMAANTRVIRINSNMNSSTGIHEELPEHYQITFPQVSRLTDKDIYTAKEVLVFVADSFSSSQSLEMAAKAQAAIETKMGINSGQSAEKLLKTIILDYNYYHSR